ncbi:TetR family transcriptional regulator [Candidatus Dojkabacteria bacterium]|nr:TetR family transcriptional regulator [Candidatus Dojkabacteria bacterium]
MTAKRNKEKTISKIIKVSIKLFEKKGFNNTSTEEIADEAGVAHGTIFYYFPKRADLVIAAIYEAMKKLAYQIILKSKNKSSLEELCELFIDEVMKNSKFYSKLVKELPIMPLKTQRLIYASLSGFSTYFVEEIKRIRKDKKRIPAHLFSFFWFGMINYIFSYEELLNSEKILYEHKNELIQIFVNSVKNT